MKQLYFIILFACSIQFYGQEDRILISGEIKSELFPIENAHIINLNSKIGTVSDKNGLFNIAIKINDTLLFSDIQFENKMILILKHHIEKKYLKVNFQPDINELDEIVINTKNMAGILGLPNADVIPLNHTERKVNYYKKAGTITKIYGLISGEQKKRKKLLKLEEGDKETNHERREILKIRTHFNDRFFTESLQIPKDSINNFITSCLSQGIISLYKEERYLEIVDIFLNKKN